MALTHLVDTSVLTRLRHVEVREVIEPLAAVGRLGRATISDLEIGFSARNAREWAQLMAALEVFEPVPVDSRDFDRALQVQRVLADKGLRGRKIPDLLVAAVAEALHLTVLHYDGDFDHIAAATGQSVEWVVPGGTID